MKNLEFRKVLLSQFLILHFAFCILVLLVSCSKPEQPKHNVLLITLDTFRADRIGTLTPNLSTLAREGVVFTNASSPVPLTLPAHASILSGLLPLHHGVRNNGAGVFPADRPTLGTALSGAGWRSGAFVGAFVLDRRFGLSRGFETYDDEIARDPNVDVSLEAERIGSEVVDRAVAWIRRSDQRPFFAWVHLWDAHAPYSPPAPFPQTYDGEIAYVDAQIGRLLAVVDRKQTIVVVVGDHGEALGDHGESTHGLLLYESTLHVPLIVASPDFAPRQIAQPASTIDVGPTVSGLAGLTGSGLPPGDGRDWSVMLRGKAELPPADLYAETQYPLVFGWSELSALRRSNVKVIAGPSSELYDLTADPAEKINRAAEDRRQLRELSQKLSALRATAVASTAVVDDETRRRLASLGYVAPGSTTNARPVDPKTMAPLLGRFEEALRQLNSDETREAIPTLRELVEKDPRNPAFRSTLARAYRQSGNLKQALALYREAVALSPGDADAWYNLATALQEAGRAEEARATLDEVIRLDPRRPEAHNALGVLRATQGDAVAAASSFQRAVDLDPRNARAFNNLGNALRGAGRNSEAAAAYGRAVEIAPRYPDPRNGLGVLLVQEGRPREALVHFDAALQLAPDFHEARINRAIALDTAGDRTAAIQEIERLIQKLPPGPAHVEERKLAATLLRRFRQ